MMLWVRATRTQFAGVAMLLAAALAAPTAATMLSIPSLSAQGWVGVPFAAVLAIVPAGAVLGGWRCIPAALGAVASRYRITIAIASSWAAVLLSGLILLVLLGASDTVIVRNVAGLVAIGLLVWRFFGRDAALAAPVVYAVLACVFGSRGYGHGAYWWAWILQDGGDPGAALMVCVMALAGVLLYAGAVKADLARGVDVMA